MRVVGRYDGLPLGGIIITTLVVFNPWLRQAIATARQLEATWGLELVTALIILVVMFVFQQHGKYREAQALAAGASRDAANARDRVRELESLAAFGRMLSRARTVEQVREVLWRHLPLVLDGGEAWVLMRTGGNWEVVLDTALDPGPLRVAALVEAADLACREGAEDGEAAPDVPERIVLPLTAADQLMGVMGVEFGTPEAEERLRRRAPAIAALVAVALRTAQLFREIRENSLYDQLTGCATRAHGSELANIELSRARRHGHATSLFLLDLDDFKDINDTHGHLAGDAVLQAVGRRLRSSLRCSDIVCRYGGDEFFVLLPETPGAAAQGVAQFVAEQIRSLQTHAAGADLKVTASIGVATIPPVPPRGGDAVTLSSVIERADEALYLAKRAGPGRVEGPLEVRASHTALEVLPPQAARQCAAG
ncbi:MAG: GGDEF domain-containing protein [Vicinamibacterales bacterium]